MPFAMPAARASTHFCGSLSFISTKTDISAGQRADDEHHLPRFQAERQRGRQADEHADRARREIAQGRKRLQHAERRRARLVRHGVGDERDREARTRRPRPGR